MSLALLQLMGGFVLLAAGAEGLVRGAAAIALRLGVSALVVGLTVVAFGTSAPELVVSVKAALAGNPGIAVGNVVGSNIFNIAVILGASAVLAPIACHVAIIRREVPLMIAVGGALLAIVWTGPPDGGGYISRGEGLAALALGVLYTYGVYWVSQRARRRSPGLEAEFAGDIVVGEPAAEVARGPLLLDLALVAGGVALLAVGAELLVAGSITVARWAGLSDTVIGLTVISCGTSLPELATSLVAAYRKEPDISLGNVVGSCIFNVLWILGATATVAPLDVDPVILARDLPVMLALSVLLLPIVVTGRVISRKEGALLLALYAGYLALLLVQSR